MSVRTGLEPSSWGKRKVVPRVTFALGLTFAAACIAGDERCDANQVFQADTCVCVPRSVPSEKGYGCTACGVNEEVQNGKCACMAGYARAGAGGACEMSAVGMACQDATQCSPAFPYCLSDGAEKYCTVQGCAATTCPTGYACEQAGGMTHCQKLPDGLGDPCTSDGDCTKEAKSCDTFMTRRCIMTGCATGAVTCPGFYGCCDLSMFVPGFSACFPPEALTGGQCPGGGKLVTP